MDLSFATASELVDALTHGVLSSRELLDHVAARIDAHNPALNAVVTLDLERAADAAAAADDAHARGERLGPLHGLVITIKDVWETEGLRTTSGAPELRDYVPSVDAITVARLRAAGAVIAGKTNTPLYASDHQTFNELFGQTNNPWDLSRTPGGSSGGRGRGRRGRPRPARARQRHRRVHPGAGGVLWHLRLEADVGSRPVRGVTSRVRPAPSSRRT